MEAEKNLIVLFFVVVVVFCFLKDTIRTKKKPICKHIITKRLVVRRSRSCQ